MVGAELGSAVVGQQREEQRAEHTGFGVKLWNNQSPSFKMKQLIY